MKGENYCERPTVRQSKTPVLLYMTVILLHPSESTEENRGNNLKQGVL
jgi:hypothetical protein